MPSHHTAPAKPAKHPDFIYYEEEPLNGAPPHTNELAALKKAKGETKDHLLTEYIEGAEKTVAEHLKKAKELDEKLTTK